MVNGHKFFSRESLHSVPAHRIKHSLPSICSEYSEISVINQVHINSKRHIKYICYVKTRRKIFYWCSHWRSLTKQVNNIFIDVISYYPKVHNKILYRNKKLCSCCHAVNKGGGYANIYYIAYNIKFLQGILMCHLIYVQIQCLLKQEFIFYKQINTFQRHQN